MDSNRGWTDHRRVPVLADEGLWSQFEHQFRTFAELDEQNGHSGISNADFLDEEVIHASIGLSPADEPDRAHDRHARDEWRAHRVACTRGAACLEMAVQGTMRLREMARVAR